MPADWKRNPDSDARHNSEVAEYKGHTMEIFSDDAGRRWGFDVDKSTVTRGDHENRRSAQEGAERFVDILAKSPT